jgi:hypothetical protein
MKFFEFGLDLLLDGIERLRDASPAVSARPGRRQRGRRTSP